MTVKRKSLIGYGVLIVISALLLTRLLHYRTLYEALAENLVLPAGTPRVLEPPPELDMKQAAVAIVTDAGSINTQIIWGGVHYGVKEGLRPLETDIGMELPRHYFNDIVGEVRTFITHAANSAIQGEDIAEGLAAQELTSQPPADQEARREMILTRSDRRKDLELLLQAIRRQLGEMDRL